MGWWATGNNDDVIGDDPADTMMDALSKVVSLYGKQNAPTLTLHELLNVVLLALRLNPKVILAVGENPSQHRLVARETGVGREIRSDSIPVADDRLVRLFFDTFAEIAAQYEESELRRKPRVSEILEILRFVLGHRADSYQSVTDQVPLENIKAELLDDANQT